MNWIDAYLEDMDSRAYQKQRQEEAQREAEHRLQVNIAKDGAYRRGMARGHDDLLNLGKLLEVVRREVIERTVRDMTIHVTEQIKRQVPDSIVHKLMDRIARAWLDERMVDVDYQLASFRYSPDEFDGSATFRLFIPEIRISNRITREDIREARAASEVSSRVFL